jgi:hypothetical protein
VTAGKQQPHAAVARVGGWGGAANFQKLRAPRPPTPRQRIGKFSQGPFPKGGAFFHSGQFQKILPLFSRFRDLSRVRCRCLRSAALTRLAKGFARGCMHDWDRSMRPVHCRSLQGDSRNTTGKSRGQCDKMPTPTLLSDVAQRRAARRHAHTVAHNRRFDDLRSSRQPNCCAVWSRRAPTRHPRLHIRARLCGAAQRRDEPPAERVERHLAGLMIAADDQHVLARHGVPPRPVVVRRPSRALSRRNRRGPAA